MSESSRNIQETIQTFEEVPGEQKCKPKKKSKLTSKSKVTNWFKTSRYAGIPFALLFGLYFYYLVTSLILDTGNNLEVTEPENEFHLNYTEKQIVEVDCIKKVYGEDNNESKNFTLINDANLVWKR